MKESRTKKTRRNIVISYTYAALNFLFSFVFRTIINTRLGPDYLGVSSLFSSILGVLGIAELGFNGAIIFSMYKPLAEGDDEAVCSLLNFYKRVYRVIGAIIIGAGLCITPFVPKLIHGTYPESLNIYILFVLYLFNTAISYWLFSYKNALLTALQRMDLTKIAYLVVCGIQYSMQLVALLVFKDYYLFMAATILSTALRNIGVAIIAKKKFPQFVCRGEISKKVQGNITKRIKGLLVCNVSGMTYSTFDSIVLSACIGLTSVAIYGNYTMIFSTVVDMVALIRFAMQSSVGDSIASESLEKNYNDMKLWQFFFSMLASVCSVCLVCLFQPLMVIWMGEEMLLPFIDVIFIAMWFFATVSTYSYCLYLTGGGLWWEMRWAYIGSTVCNIVLNFVLGKIFGTEGIIFSSLFAVVVFCLIWQSKIVLKNYFKKSNKGFLLRQLLYFLVTIPVCAAAYYCCSLVSAEGIVGLVLKGIVSVFVSGVLLILVYCKTSIFKRAFQFFTTAIKAR